MAAKAVVLCANTGHPGCNVKSPYTVEQTAGLPEE